MASSARMATASQLQLASLLVLVHLLTVSLFGHAAASLQAEIEATLTLESDDDTDSFANGIKFQLYTRKNMYDPEFINISDTRGDPPKYFDANKPVKIITHGWKSSMVEVTLLKDAFLRVMDVNCILVNWTKVDTIFYPVASKNVPFIGQQLSLLLDYLRDVHAVQPATMHLIGHSLGAHISGLGARYMREGIVGRITGLDPAGVLIPKVADQRLDKSDASFVDVIHTCANVLGLPSPIGHVDFFPNGGTCPQPGCMLKDLTHGCCSHIRAVDYMEESILDRGCFKAFPCKGEWDTPDYDGEGIFMGLDAPLNATGSYCLVTRDSKPFATSPLKSTEGIFKIRPLLYSARTTNKEGSDHNGLPKDFKNAAQAQLKIERRLLRSFLRPNNFISLEN